MTERTILLPLDGSRTARRALPYAAALACLGQPARVTLLTVLPPRASADIPYETPARDRMQRVAERRLRAAARRLKALGVRELETEWVWGLHDDDEILRIAEERRATFIVMGTHGRGGLPRALLGSTTMSVLRRTSVPCVVVPPGALIDKVSIRRALLAIDGSETSERAVPMALALAAAGVHVSVLQVVPPSATLIPFTMPGVEGYIPYSVMEDLTAAAKATVKRVSAQFPQGAADGEVLLGAPGRAILDYAGEHAIDLIVMTAHARSALGRAFLGSVTDRVIRTAKNPVLVVPPER